MKDKYFIVVDYLINDISLYSVDDSPEATECDFQRVVESLRPDAPIFLKMINEVKRKLNLLEDKTTKQGMQYK